MDKTNLLLSELAGGRLQQQFNRVLNRVLENIGDENTEPEKAREITIKITIKPDEYREMSDVTCVVSSKLVPEELGLKFILGRDIEQNFVAKEFKNQIPGQLAMEEPVENVRTLYK